MLAAQVHGAKRAAQTDGRGRAKEAAISDGLPSSRVETVLELEHVASDRHLHPRRHEPARLLRAVDSAINEPAAPAKPASSLPCQRDRISTGPERRQRPGQRELSESDFEHKYPRPELQGPAARVSSRHCQARPTSPSGADGTAPEPPLPSRLQHRAGNWPLLLPTQQAGLSWTADMPGSAPRDCHATTQQAVETPDLSHSSLAPHHTASLRRSAILADRPPGVGWTRACALSGATTMPAPPDTVRPDPQTVAETPELDETWRADEAERRLW